MDHPHLRRIGRPALKKTTAKRAAQVEPVVQTQAATMAQAEPSNHADSLKRVFPAPLKWVISADNTEITLLVGGVRRGAIVPWCDSTTREPAGWTAVLATPHGNQDVRSTHFWMPEEQAKVELLLALVASGVLPEVQAAPIVLDLRDAVGPAQPRPASVPDDTVFVRQFGSAPPPSADADRTIPSADADRTIPSTKADPAAQAFALLDQARAALLAGGVIDLSIMLIQRDAAGRDTPVILTTGLLGDRVRLAHAQQALDGLGGQGAAARRG